MTREQLAEARLPVGTPIVLTSSQRRSFARYVGRLEIPQPDGTVLDVTGWLLERYPHLFSGRPAALGGYGA